MLLLLALLLNFPLNVSVILFHEEEYMYYLKWAKLLSIKFLISQCREECEKIGLNIDNDVKPNLINSVSEFMK